MCYLHGEPGDPLAAGISEQAVGVCTTRHTRYTTQNSPKSCSYSSECSANITWWRKLLLLTAGALRKQHKSLIRWSAFLCTRTSSPLKTIKTRVSALFWISTTIIYGLFFRSVIMWLMFYMFCCKCFGRVPLGAAEEQFHSDVPVPDMWEGLTKKSTNTGAASSSCCQQLEYRCADTQNKCGEAVMTRIQIKFTALHSLQSITWRTADHPPDTLNANVPNKDLVRSVRGFWNILLTNRPTQTSTNAQKRWN